MVMPSRFNAIWDWHNDPMFGFVTPAAPGITWGSNGKNVAPVSVTITGPVSVRNTEEATQLLTGAARAAGLV